MMPESTRTQAKTVVALRLESSVMVMPVVDGAVPPSSNHDSGFTRPDRLYSRASRRRARRLKSASWPMSPGW